MPGCAEPWRAGRRSSSCNVSTASNGSDSELCHYCQTPSMNGRGIAAVMFVWKLAGSVKPDGSGFIFAMFCRFLFYFLSRPLFSSLFLSSYHSPCPNVFHLCSAVSTVFIYLSQIPCQIVSSLMCELSSISLIISFVRRLLTVF